MKVPKAKKQTNAQILLRKHLTELGIASEIEYRFSKLRRWRFDIYLPEHRIGIEVNGMGFGGQHARQFQAHKEHEKMNVAQMLGFRVLVFTNKEVLNGSAKAFLQEWLRPIEKAGTDGL